MSSLEKALWPILVLIMFLLGTIYYELYFS